MDDTEDRRGFICKVLGGLVTALIKAKEAKNRRDHKQKPSAEVEISPKPGKPRQGLNYYTTRTFTGRMRHGES